MMSVGEINRRQYHKWYMTVFLVESKIDMYILHNPTSICALLKPSKAELKKRFKWKKTFGTLFALTETFLLHKYAITNKSLKTYPRSLSAKATAQKFGIPLLIT